MGNVSPVVLVSVCKYGVMPRADKLAPTLAALVLAVTGLAGCAATAAPQVADPSPEPASQTPEEEAAQVTAEPDPDACVNPAWINLSTEGVSITGDIEDRGAREFAQGAVGRDDEGNIVSYTVATGDVAAAIGERLCIENGLALTTLNHTRTVHPDQVLRLDPDPDLRFIPYYNPWDAPAGFEQIPYQAAIEAMGHAADAGDVDTMRGIWADTLSGMFTDSADISAIQQALDAGDLAVLTEMFS